MSFNEKDMDHFYTHVECDRIARPIVVLKEDVYANLLYEIDVDSP